MTTIHWTFNYPNSKWMDWLLQWMTLSGEVPTKRRDQQVVGFTRKENHNFWLAEKRLNYHWHQGMTFAIRVACLVFSTKFFFVSFDANIVSHVFFQAVNIAHFFFFFYRFLHIIYTLNFFVVTLIRFFRNKFRQITRRIERLKVEKKSRANNRKLARLVYEFNVVHLELFAMRELFKQFIGHNLCHCFALALLTTFGSMSAQKRMALLVHPIVFVMGLATIFPFYFATSVIIEVLVVTTLIPLKGSPVSNHEPRFVLKSDRVKHNLENMAFKRSTKLAIKLKIDSLGNLRDRVGFACFDWFQIGSLRGILASE